MSLADKLAFSMGSKLEGDNHDTQKEDKKNSKQSVNSSKNSSNICKFK